MEPMFVIALMLSVAIATLTTNAVIFLLIAMYVKGYIYKNTENYKAAVQKYVDSVANYQAALRAQEEKNANKYSRGGFN